MDLESLRREVSSFLSTRWPIPEGVKERSFSPFDNGQVEAASKLADGFSRIARGAGGEEAGIRAVLEQARTEVQTRLPGLVKYALMIFLTHDPTGARVGPPPLEERHPSAVRSMAEARAEGAKQAPGLNLFFFREDIAANEHHEHWHLVYRAGERHEKERQGEL
jgi:tyrosinase